MNNFRNVNDDILKEWLNFREETDLAFVNEEDRKHTVKFDDFSENILNSIPKQNRKFVEKQLDLLNSSFFDYIVYWNEKYYRNGFCDGVELIIGCIDRYLKLIQRFFKILKKLWIFTYFFQIGENIDYNIFFTY